MTALTVSFFRENMYGSFSRTKKIGRNNVRRGSTIKHTVFLLSTPILEALIITSLADIFKPVEIVAFVV